MPTCVTSAYLSGRSPDVWHTPSRSSSSLSVISAIAGDVATSFGSLSPVSSVFSLLPAASPGCWLTHPARSAEQGKYKTAAAYSLQLFHSSLLLVSVFAVKSKIPSGQRRCGNDHNPCYDPCSRTSPGSLFLLSVTVRFFTGSVIFYNAPFGRFLICFFFRIGVFFCLVFPGLLFCFFFFCFCGTCFFRAVFCLCGVTALGCAAVFGGCAP